MKTHRKRAMDWQLQAISPTDLPLVKTYNRVIRIYRVIRNNDSQMTR